MIMIASPFPSCEHIPWNILIISVCFVKEKIFHFHIIMHISHRKIDRENILRVALQLFYSYHVFHVGYFMEMATQSTSAIRHHHILRPHSSPLLSSPFDLVGQRPNAALYRILAIGQQQIFDTHRVGFRCMSEPKD